MKKELEKEIKKMTNNQEKLNKDFEENFHLGIDRDEIFEIGLKYRILQWMNERTIPKADVERVEQELGSDLPLESSERRRGYQQALQDFHHHLNLDK